MSTLQTLLDDLNRRLSDANNAAGVGEATKIGWLNSGVAAMWPSVYRTVGDTTLAVVANQYEYNIPAAVGNESEIFRVEIEDQNAPGVRFLELDGFDIVPVLTSRVLQLSDYIVRDSGYAGALIRITAAKPISAMATVGATFEGRAVHEELPVWYAFGLSLARRLEDRTDHTRYSTVEGRNGVDIGEQIISAQFCFAQFEAMLARMAMPWPASVG